MKLKIKENVKIAIVTFLIATILGIYIGHALTPTTTFTISPGVYPGAPDYTIWKEGSNYFAKNKYGEIEFSGTNKTEIVQNAIDAIPEGVGGVVVLQNFYIDDYQKLSIPLNVEVSEHWGGRTRRFVRYDTVYSFAEEYGILKYRPSIPRFTARGACTNVVLKEGCLVLCARKDIVGGTAGEVYFAKAFSYGNYSWKAKLATDPPSGWTIYLGFGEEFPSGYRNSIFVEWNGTDWVFATREDGMKEITVLSSADMPIGVTKTLRVDWSADEVKFYIDGELKATHNTRIPHVKMIAFVEIVSGSAATENVYVYVRDYQKLFA